MKIVCLATLFSATFLVVSCQQNPQIPAASETPKALQESSTGSLATTKRGYGDLLDELYQERVDASAELQDLERNIEALVQLEDDSTRQYLNFSVKSQSYYGAAQNRASQFSDSSLKAQVIAIILDSKTRFDSLTAPQRLIMEDIHSKNLRLSDLHGLLKISQTIPMIEAYQRTHLPDARPLKAHLRQLDKVLGQTGKTVTDR